MTERTVPILLCGDLDEMVTFYVALGFVQTYRQDRPYAYLCLRRDAIDMHFHGTPDFDPDTSAGNVLWLVPDPGPLYDVLAAGLRAAFGRLPVAGTPRITRPRRKRDTSGGFAVVDPAGNWLRVTRTEGDRTTDDSAEPEDRLGRVLLSAARQGDSRGHADRAIAVLDAGLARHADAPTADRVPLLVYRAELLVRIGDREGAAAVLAEIDALDLDAAAHARLTDDLAFAAELARDGADPTTPNGHR